MPLRSTPVSRSLDRHLQIAGFDVIDILAVFFVLAVLNLVFGRTGYRLAMVWAPTALLAGVLRLGKRGKPENHLLHLIRYFVRPRLLSAFLEPSNWEVPPQPITQEVA